MLSAAASVRWFGPKALFRECRCPLRDGERLWISAGLAQLLNLSLESEQLLIGLGEAGRPRQQCSADNATCHKSRVSNVHGPHLRYSNTDLIVRVSGTPEPRYERFGSNLTSANVRQLYPRIAD